MDATLQAAEKAGRRFRWVLAIAATIALYLIAVALWVLAINTGDVEIATRSRTPVIVEADPPQTHEVYRVGDRICRQCL